MFELSESQAFSWLPVFRYLGGSGAHFLERTCRSARLEAASRCATSLWRAFCADAGVAVGYQEEEISVLRSVHRVGIATAGEHWELGDREDVTRFIGLGGLSAALGRPCLGPSVRVSMRFDPEVANSLEAFLHKIQSEDGITLTETLHFCTHQRFELYLPKGAPCGAISRHDLFKRRRIMGHGMDCSSLVKVDGDISLCIDVADPYDTVFLRAGFFVKLAPPAVSEIMPEEAYQDVLLATRFSLLPIDHEHDVWCDDDVQGGIPLEEEIDADGVFLDPNEWFGECYACDFDDLTDIVCTGKRGVLAWLNALASGAPMRYLLVQRNKISQECIPSPVAAAAHRQGTSPALYFSKDTTGSENEDTPIGIMSCV